MKIFTLGYEKRNIEEYIKILKTADVKILIDVRETAWSYKQDFCKVKFSTALQSSGIHYLHIRDLGNPKRLRKANAGHAEILNSYRSYLNDTQAGITPLLELLQEASKRKLNICLTCFERDHKSCHRSVITDHISTSVEHCITHL